MIDDPNSFATHLKRLCETDRECEILYSMSMLKIKKYMYSMLIFLFHLSVELEQKEQEFMAQSSQNLSLDETIKTKQQQVS